MESEPRLCAAGCSRLPMRGRLYCWSCAPPASPPVPAMISIPKTEHERLLAADERCERLEAAFKDLSKAAEILPYEKLILLADWFDLDDARKDNPNNGMQTALRQYAGARYDVLAALETK